MRLLETRSSPVRTEPPIDGRNWRRRVFTPAAKGAGVPHATPHQLRHRMASLMASQGYSAAPIAAHLGHADGEQLALKPTSIRTALSPPTS